MTRFIIPLLVILLLFPMALLQAQDKLTPVQEQKAVEPAAEEDKTADANAADKKGEAEAGEEEKKEEDKSKFKSSSFSALKLRCIGPALMSGRVGDIAVAPDDPSTWYVAVSSGGVWKTVNAGTTWKPIFDHYGSYSIGCVAVAPTRPNTVWVGSGENNSQRSVAFGDGVYKSLDGGRSFTNMGLKESEHIGKILIHPEDEKVVYVAAQGPLWAPGGDRGLYKTADGGKTWNLILEISENTGVSDILFDPCDPEVIYASSYQRRRHVWTLINGGPESAIHKSTDGGATWRKLKKGLPGGDVGRIGLAISPQNPEVVYALVEAAGNGGGFFRSGDGGNNWSKMSSYNCTSAQYYQEIYACPFKFDRVYSMDTWMQVTDDGGKTFKRVGEKFKHVDNHALVFDLRDPEYLLAGCDGGVYESFDRGAHWAYKANLPVTQFYKVSVDYDTPFYNVYGGTQDNNTQGGPSRTRNINGITNRDWFCLKGGDGFKPYADPNDPDIIYAQSQYGVLARYDRTNGETVSIQPQPGKGEPGLRWNWDAALLISPHDHKQIYFAANRLFRSPDRGDSWEAISPDLSRQLDRNKLEVMGKVWNVDAVAKSNSTSCYGNIVSVAESPIVRDLLYVGTDDGLIQVSENGGQAWRKIDSFPDIPELSYVADVEACMHDGDTVFAVFNNMKGGDFKPYILKSADRGATWSPIQGNLPERGPVWAVAQDHVNKDLIFAGTEFGVFFTRDGGEKWIQLKSGVPVIGMRDLEIQRRENDLVCASFGRGFYILDDYTPLRHVTEELLEKEEAFIFPVKTALQYVPAKPLGWSEKGSQGYGFFTAPNPPYGAVITYYLKDSLKTRKQKRKDAEKEAAKEDKEVPYPTWDELRLEDREEGPAIIFTITDAAGEVVRRFTGSTSAGTHRAVWNLRYPAYNPTELRSAKDGNPWDRTPSGPMVGPGKYTVHMEKRVEGKFTPMAGPQTFEVKYLGISALPAPDRAEVLAFQKKTGELLRAAMGASRVASDAAERIKYIIKTIHDTPAGNEKLALEARALDLRLKDLQLTFSGDSTMSKRNKETPPSIMGRARSAAYGSWGTTYGPTASHRKNYDIAAEEFEPWLAALKTLVKVDLKNLEDRLEMLGAPWTPGRFPDWKR